MKYYAVHKGHKKGVFDNWGECQASINGYSGAVFKKCNTQSEANYFCEYGKLPIKKYEKLDTFFGGSNLNKRMSSSTIVQKTAGHLPLQRSSNQLFIISAPRSPSCTCCLL